MRLIDVLAGSFPNLDLECVRILLQIHETPGYSIRELADILSLDPKAAQQKIKRLGSGRKDRHGAAYGLVDEDYSLADCRKRALTLSGAGAELAEKLMILTAVMPQK